MIGALLKKQLMESFAFLFTDRKKKQGRSKGGKIAMAVLYLVLFGYLGVMFFYMAKMLCEPLCAVGFGWLAFVMSSLVAVILGVVGSVFSTHTTLYGAKDNDMLLAMPIPPRVILFARLAGVYLTGLLYELIVMVPTLIAWFMYGNLTPLGGIFSILIVFVLSLFVLTLSCLLGFLLALVSSRVKNKNVAMVILALGFLGLYFFLYSKVLAMLTDILLYADSLADGVKTALYPFYQMGLAAEGKPLAMLIFTAMVLGLFALTFLLVARSFLKLAIANPGTAKRKYVEKAAKAGNANGALLRRELKRFVGSPTYMLNCGLGLVMIVVLAVFLLIKGGDLFLLIAPLLPTDLMPLIGAAACGMMAGMSYITAPSVSLEGKQIWLAHVLPVSAWQVLMAKLKLHMLLVTPPTALMLAAVLIVLRPSVALCFLIPLAVLIFVLFVALLGLCMNLKFCRLDWASETVPVKQSAAVFYTMFGSWLAVGVPAIACYLLWGKLSPAVFMLCVSLLFAAADAGMLYWIYRRGTRIFDTL
jgi:ABC-2 type transport system permease protein